MCHQRRRLAGLLLAAILGGNGIVALAAEGELPAVEQVNREGGVTVKVVPRSLRAAAPSWDFDVTLETHTQSLNQDMLHAARLIDAQGKPHAPLAWDGDPPGGHHRRGRLRFQPLAGSPAAVELRITGVGGVETRTFRWRPE